ncbi:hypothetical protein HFN89_07010 [Rhizobium laguerreae]|nr:hypothetical protein [Rhizobium laguerreae]
MIIEVDYPEFQLAMPGQSRTQKALWMRRRASLDIAAYRVIDVVRAVKYKREGDQFQTELFRIGSRHFKMAEHRSPRGDGRKAGDAKTMAAYSLCEGAWSWFTKNVPINTSIVPEMSNSSSALANMLHDLPVYGDVAFRNPDERLRADFESHMAGVVAGLVTIDGNLFEPCGEPVYVVTGYGSHTVIEISTAEELPDSATAVFALGCYSEAEAFARTFAHKNGLRYGEIVRDVAEGAGAIRDDAEVRTLSHAARIAVSRFEDTYAGFHLQRENVLRLMQSVPLEDIAIYRRLKELSQTTDNADVYADRLFETLSDAENSTHSAAVFTDQRRFPLADILSLWEDRPISVPGHRAPAP